MSKWKFPILTWIRKVLGHEKKPADPADYYPAGMAVRCESWKNWAYDHVHRRTGKDLRKLYGWTVTLKPCDWNVEKRRFCWQSSGGIWVAAETMGRFTEMAIGHNMNLADVGDNDGKHEACHYWMGQNGMPDPGHNLYPEVWT